jgi:hypothetical protein
MTHPQLIHAALDEDGDEIILRGVIDPKTFCHLLVDSYQREKLPISSKSSILDALQKQEVLPDVELAMRGEAYEDVGGVFILKSPTYIVDGLQRISTAIHFLDTEPGARVRLGAKVSFSTNRDWEMDRFRKLNSNRTRVSPNIMLRNKHESSAAVGMLYRLCSSAQFCMKDKVSWRQSMLRTEQISALTLAKVMGTLHSHQAAALSSDVDDLIVGLDRVVQAIGIKAVRKNMLTFFDLVDECWNIRHVQQRATAPQLKNQFLLTFARVLSKHYNFWRGEGEKELFLDRPLRKKIGTFSLADPHVRDLAGGSGKSRDILYILMIGHINSGKRTNHLRSRDGITTSDCNGIEEEEVD